MHRTPCSPEVGLQKERLETSLKELKLGNRSTVSLLVSRKRVLFETAKEVCVKMLQ